MTARVFVIGREGQLARELARAPWPQGWSATFAEPPDLDLTKPDRAAEVVAAAKPDLVVNAAAYTNVEQAEDDFERALLINATGPAAVAAACRTIGVPFVTISTDYVFDGTKPGAYTENDPVRPIGAYGRSKAEGEATIRQANDRHVILRTSWLFSPFGTNFVKTMMRLGGERREVRVVADQRGRPTCAGDLARAVVAVCGAIRSGQARFGTYHFANAGAVSWFDFAQAIFEGLAARGETVPEQVVPVTTAEFPTKAVRPANSELDCGLIERRYGIAIRPWQAALNECLDELVARKRRDGNN